MLSLRALRPPTSTSRCTAALTLTRRYSSTSHSPPPDLRINSSRLRSTIDEVTTLSHPAPIPTSGYLPPPHTAPNRLAIYKLSQLTNPPGSQSAPTGTSLLPSTISLRHYLTTALGLPPLIDDLGSLYLCTPSHRPSAPTIALGGPLDSSPLPLLAALEVLRTLRDAAIIPTHPITLIGWSCSSGSRFPRALLGSSVWAGLVGVEEAWSLREAGREEGRRTVKACLREAGWLGSLQQSLQLAAYFEVVGGSGEVVGVGGGTEACRWLEVLVRGGDAVAAAGRCVLAARELGGRNNAKVRTRVFEAVPASFGETVGEVRFDVRIHAPTRVGVELVQRECEKVWAQVCKEEKAGVEGVTCLMDEPEEVFTATAVDAVKEALEDVSGEEAAKESVVEGVVDAANTSRRGVPTGVVTVPQAKGDEAW
jgi:N-carbamoyl-L-amino-acid hydrolase